MERSTESKLVPPGESLLNMQPVAMVVV